MAAQGGGGSPALGDCDLFPGGSLVAFRLSAADLAVCDPNPITWPMDLPADCRWCVLMDLDSVTDSSNLFLLGELLLLTLPTPIYAERIIPHSRFCARPHFAA